MNNGDMPAGATFDKYGRHGSIVCNQGFSHEVTGLTKREAFAKDLPHLDVEFNNMRNMCEFLGIDEPNGIEEIMNVTFACEAKIRVMRADALLKELEK